MHTPYTCKPSISPSVPQMKVDILSIFHYKIGAKVFSLSHPSKWAAAVFYQLIFHIKLSPQIFDQNGLQRTPYIYLMSLLWLIVSLHNGEVWAAAANFLVFNTHSIFVSNYVAGSFCTGILGTE